MFINLTLLSTSLQQVTQFLVNTGTNYFMVIQFLDNPGQPISEIKIKYLNSKKEGGSSSSSDIQSVTPNTPSAGLDANAVLCVAHMNNLIV